ncbi:MAG: hypothetical protein MR413_07925, partial [Clostridia bacterium]|nr:hypothetical protein [Clostridia bacterium]
MNKSKKFLAFLTALSISASSFVGAATAVFAAENSISYQDGTVSITYDAEKDAKLIVAKYNANKTLQSVESADVKLTNGTTQVNASEKNLTVDDGDVLMVWDSFTGMIPLMEKVTYTAPTPTPTVDPYVRPVAATYIDQSNPDAEHSTATTLKTGYNKISNNTVGFANTGWGVNYATLIKFDLNDQLENGESVTKAVLSYKATADAARGRNHIIGSTTKKDWDATVTYEGLDSSIPFAQIGDAHAINKGTTVTITQDITDYAKTQTDNILALCVIDTSAGGSDINKSSIVLEIEKMNPDSQVKVTYVVEDTSTDEIVKKGEKPVSVPNPTKKGYIFNGWKVGDTDTVLTSVQVADTVFDVNTVLTAQFTLDTEYVQSIASVDFIDTEGKTIAPRNVKAMSYPTEADTVSYEPYEIKVTSDIGNDITDDCTITWTAVGGGGIDAGYFQFVEKKDEDSADTVVSSKRYARLRQGGESWFGYIKADVTYNPPNSDDETKNTTGSAQIPCAAVNGGKAANQIIPAAGYPESMDYYVDELLGYQCTSGIYTDGYDPVLNNWSITGSNGTRDLLLVKEGDKKAIKITNTGGPWGPAGNSTLGVYAFPAQTAQYVLETVIMFEGDGARLGVWDKTPNNAKPSAEWSVSYSGGAINVGDAKISGVDAKTWYKLVITSDPTNDIYSVYVYDMEGNLVGTPVEGAQGADITPKFLCVDGGFPVYINSLKAYTPSVDSVQITSDTDVVRVPENDTDVEQVSLSANCKTADGIKLTGAVDWSLAQEYQGVTLEKGVQTAVLKVQKGAAGTVQVNATMGGKSATKTITLTNSSNVVSFKQSKTSITIPFENEENATAVFKADTITSESPEGINDASITYSFLDKTGAAELATLPNGITSNVENGTLTLTVAPGATPAVFYVKATNSEGLSTKTQVNVHGLSYQFGTTVEEGYTQVTAATLYNETLGYGFESTSGLTDAETSVSGTAAYKFKANVPNGNYKITVNTTSASMKSEIVDSLVSSSVKGVTKSGNEFNVAVCDGVLDLTFDANSTISLLSIAQIAKPEQRENPKIYAIGDSTTQNSNGGNLSWGSHIANGSVEIPAAFSGFSNNGKSGADSVSFYNGGLIEAVLLDIHPGDYVSVNMGINHNRDGANECAAFVPLLSKYYIEAIQERGGIPVITTSTPIGYNADPNKGWTESNGKIICNRGTDAHNGDLRKLAVQYNLNIIELGYYFESYFNDEIQIDGQKISDEAVAAGTTALELAKSWYGDHNHYKQPLADKIAKYMLNCFAQIEGGS